MTNVVHYVGQALFYILIAGFIGYFANRPLYHQWPQDMAQIKLSFAHGAQRKIPCRRLTPKEIAKLPPNERRPNTCSRERLPVKVQLEVDSQIVYDEVLEPTGLSRDGPSRAYKKFQIPPGEHVIVARLRDSKRAEGFDYEKELAVELKPLQNLAIDFKADAGGFIFR